MKKFISFIVIYLIMMPAFAASNYTYSTPKTYEYNSLSTTAPTEKILFIVDFSNSMNERLGSKTKLEIALDTMRQTLQMIPPSTAVGLRVYGHKTGFTPRQSCTASELISPIQQNNALNVYSKLNSVSAVGWTPITHSLKQAVFFDFADNAPNKRIILISDGGENCDESPCDFIIEVMKYRDDIKIDVIALAIGDSDANNQLKCVALVTSGRFYNANTAAELKDSLEDSLRLKKDVQGVIIKK